MSRSVFVPSPTSQIPSHSATTILQRLAERCERQFVHMFAGPTQVCLHVHTGHIEGSRASLRAAAVPGAVGHN